VPADALVGVVETALARALELAARAGRWELVGQLARELEARRQNRHGRSAAEVLAICAATAAEASLGQRR
jgi:hypothetical protein